MLSPSFLVKTSITQPQNRIGQNFPDQTRSASYIIPDIKMQVKIILFLNLSTARQSCHRKKLKINGEENPSKFGS